MITVSTVGFGDMVGYNFIKRYFDRFKLSWNLTGYPNEIRPDGIHRNQTFLVQYKKDYYAPATTNRGIDQRKIFKAEFLKFPEVDLPLHLEFHDNLDSTWISQFLYSRFQERG